MTTNYPLMCISVWCSRCNQFHKLNELKKEIFQEVYAYSCGPIGLLIINRAGEAALSEEGV